MFITFPHVSAVRYSFLLKSQAGQHQSSYIGNQAHTIYCENILTRHFESPSNNIKMHTSKKQTTHSTFITDLPCL